MAENSEIDWTASSVIVVYDDDMGACFAMGLDDACEGAISCSTGTVAVFANRKQARKAIAISKAFAKLCELQGGIVNTDFTDGIKFVKVVPLHFVEAAGGGV